MLLCLRSGSFYTACVVGMTPWAPPPAPPPPPAGGGGGRGPRPPHQPAASSPWPTVPQSPSMSRTQEIRPDIDEGIDRKVLSQLRARFLKLNQGRLQRAMQALSTRQQLVLKLLPLLFHVNHPLL